MKKLVISLPNSLKELPEAKKRSVLEEIEKALNIQSTIKDKEHNIWMRNDEPLLAEAEEELYEALVEPSLQSMASLIAALGLVDEDVDIIKALKSDYLEYEEYTLIKGRNKHSKLSELWNIAREKRRGFLKYIQGQSNWSKKKLKEIDRILKKGLPDYAKVAEQYAVRAAFIAKIRDKENTEALKTLGAYVDRFPTTIAAGKTEGVTLTASPEPIKAVMDNISLTVTEEELDEALRAARANRNAAMHNYKVLPLQPQEVRTVENAEIRTAEKIAEVADRHRAGIKQVVLQAINGRWSAQKLAQTLFDMFGDQNRDWRRVAITELSMASNDAYLAGCLEGDTVVVPSVAGACKYCRQYLEGKSFIVTHDPKLMGHDHDQEMHYVWVGKTNWGRTVATYVPCVPLHPQCRHRFHKISRFYKLGEDGQLILKTTKELIQEERIRRGMPPDPKLA